jgi:solute carrier family 13 (sodium-dependent dicarboxylate transporter), member 2/3/5
MLFAILPIFTAMGITPSKSNNLSKFFIILIPLSASAGGFGTLLGGGRCPLAVDITSKYVLDTTGVALDIGFVKYMMINFPLCLFTAVATWAICYLIFRPKEVSLPAEAKIENMPKMSTLKSA